MNLSALIQGLNEAGVAFVVVGGIAAVAQGAPVTTFDLEKMVELKRESTAPKNRHRLQILEETLRLLEREGNIE